MIKHISHIGIAVSNLEEGIAFYEKLGLTLEAIEEVPSQKVKVAFFPCGDTRIEVLAPTDPESPIAKFIEKRGEGIHHIAIRVDDISAAMQSLKEKGIRLLSEEPRVGAGGALIAFVHPKTANGTLIELCERKV